MTAQELEALRDRFLAERDSPTLSPNKRHNKWLDFAEGAFGAIQMEREREQELAKKRQREREAKARQREIDMAEAARLRGEREARRREEQETVEKQAAEAREKLVEAERDKAEMARLRDDRERATMLRQQELAHRRSILYSKIVKTDFNFDGGVEDANLLKALFKEWWGEQGSLFDTKAEERNLFVDAYMARKKSHNDILFGSSPAVSYGGVASSNRLSCPSYKG